MWYLKCFRFQSLLTFLVCALVLLSGCITVLSKHPSPHSNSTISKFNVQVEGLYKTRFHGYSLISIQQKNNSHISVIPFRDIEVEPLNGDELSRYYARVVNVKSLLNHDDIQFLRNPLRTIYKYKNRRYIVDSDFFDKEVGQGLSRIIFQDGVFTSYIGNKDSGLWSIYKSGRTVVKEDHTRYSKKYYINLSIYEFWYTFLVEKNSDDLAVTSTNSCFTDNENPCEEISAMGLDSTRLVKSSPEDKFTFTFFDLTEEESNRLVGHEKANPSFTLLKVSSNDFSISFLGIKLFIIISFLIIPLRARTKAEKYLEVVQSSEYHDYFIKKLVIDEEKIRRKISGMLWIILTILVLFCIFFPNTWNELVGISITYQRQAGVLDFSAIVAMILLLIPIIIHVNFDSLLAKNIANLEKHKQLRFKLDELEKSFSERVESGANFDPKTRVLKEEPQKYDLGVVKESLDFRYKHLSVLARLGLSKLSKPQQEIEKDYSEINSIYQDLDKSLVEYVEKYDHLWRQE